MLEALRGGAIASGTRVRVRGIYDSRLVNLPCVPSKRMLQRYISTPWRIQDILRISLPMLVAPLGAFRDAVPRSGNLLAATFDCVYGESQAEIIRDLDGKYLLSAARRQTASWARR